ncbi:Sec-independent protein translocase protein TatB [Parvibaculum sp.]|uniref:Sec-independent protein translocase protein TatB n=1 Tax=Parvibaculum sp. TaxID=2024848 RepID=UPI0032111B90
MFDIGWSELLLVGVLALVFVGPKDLPRVMRTAGRYVGKMRAMAREFQQSFEDLARESELEELRKQVAELRNQSVAPLADIREAVETAGQAPKAEPETGSTEAKPEEVSARLPDDIAPGMADAIREADEIAKFGDKAVAAPRSETGQA